MTEIVVGCKSRYKNSFSFCLFVSVVEKTEIRAPDSRANEKKTWICWWRKERQEKKKHKQTQILVFFSSWHVKCFSLFWDAKKTQKIYFGNSAWWEKQCRNVSTLSSEIIHLRQEVCGHIIQFLSIFKLKTMFRLAWSFNDHQMILIRFVIS